MPAPVPIYQQPYVVVDLETTGGSALYDRVIEVAALRVEGGRVVDRVVSLVEPGVGVPPFITRLTGITPSLLRGAPRVESLLPALDRLTHGAVVVAHNVAFDHAFLAQCFRRGAVPWERDRLCTLRLARRLIPGLHSYRLDSLCAHLEFPFVQRHRAASDAEATVPLLLHLLDAAREQGIEDVAALLRFQQRPIGRPRPKSKVDESQVQNMPTGPGVYLLKDASGHVVYVGKSVNVRQRVRQHLRPSGTAASPAQPRLRKRLPYIADVEAFETGSEIEALLLESKLVKRYLPEANRMLRDFRDYPFLKLDLSDSYPRLEATRERPTDGALYFGPFRKPGAVARAALFLSEQLGLRQCTPPIRPDQSACPLLDLKKCLGPCVGAVSQDQYRAAATRAERILRGEDEGFFDEQAHRRDELAERLRFEAAADLRDRIRDVEHVVGGLRRLKTVAERNLVLVAPESGPEAARLFLVRHGRLAREVTVHLPGNPATLRALLRSVYGASAESTIGREEVDDMLILEAWLRRRQASAREIPVQPDAPEQALPEIRAALAALSTLARTA